MQLAHRWISRHLSRLEFVVAIILIAIFMGGFIRYSLEMFATVEKKMVERTVNNIQAAINFQVAMRIQSDEVIVINEITRTNPITYMTREMSMQEIFDRTGGNYSRVAGVFVPPQNYGGLVLDDSSEDLEEGLWYYDTDDRFLFYTVKNKEFFYSDATGPERIRYRLVLEYRDNNADQVFDQEVDRFESINLVQFGNAYWTI